MNTDQFFKAIINGERHFVNLHFEDEIGFSGKDLSGITFESCFLYVDFRNCNLYNVKFINCNIKELDLRHSNLTNALMTKCLVESTMFYGAIISNFEFSENYYFGHTLNQEDLSKLIEKEERAGNKT